MAISYAISGGADATKFNIDPNNGALTFKAAPDFEKPGDANADNVYEVTVKATDATGLFTTQDVRVTVKDVSEGLPPQITSAAAVSVNENQTAVLTVTATDPDEGGGSGATGGTITGFTTTPGQNFNIDGRPYCVDSAGKSHSITSPDNKTLRFEIRTGENWSAHDSSSVNRSEADGAPRVIPYGGIIKVAYKLRIEAGGSNTASWFVIGQFHNDDKGRAAELGLSEIQWTSPPYAMELYGEKFSLMLRYCPTNQNPTNGAGNLTLKRLWTDSAPVVRGRTYDIRWEIKSVNDASGYLFLWVDGNKVVDYHGPAGYGPWGVYWEFGLYREANTTTFAATYNSVTLS
jgi:Polysaccharide lyase/Cadherin domain